MRKFYVMTGFVLGLLAFVMAFAVSARAEMVNGEVRKIDQSAQKITLRHDPIKSLDMDSMTMVFRVREVALIKGLKVGDAVRFEAARVDGALTVTRIERRK